MKISNIRLANNFDRYLFTVGSVIITDPPIRLRLPHSKYLIISIFFVFLYWFRFVINRGRDSTIIYLTLLRTIIFLVIINLGLPINLYAQTRNIKFEHISIEQGLSQSSVYQILQDSKGFMWFATEDGLNKYDGYRFTVYNHDINNPHSLSNNSVNSIIEDHFGTLWIGTEGGGLNKFDRDKELFTHYKHNPADSSSLSRNFIWTICEDRTGTLWIGTVGDGLNKFDRDKESFTHYKTDSENPYSLSDNYIYIIYEDRSGNLWIGTENGLNRFDHENEHFIRFYNDPEDPYSLADNSIWSIFEDNSGSLWIGTEQGGLAKYDPETERFINYQNDPNDPNSLSNNQVYSIYEDRTGEFWVGTLAGLNKFNRQTGQFTRIEYEPDSPHGLSNDVILSIYEDRSGAIWIGTIGSGLNKFNPRQKRFLHYKRDPKTSNSLSDNHIYSIFEDQSGTLWIGTWNGLNKFERKTNLFTIYQTDVENPYSLSDNNIWSIYEDQFGFLWIGTNNGLNKFDRKTDQFVRYYHNPEDSSSVSDDNIFIVYEDQSGALWIGTENGLNKLDRKTDQFIRYQHDDSKSGSLSNNNVSAIYEDHKGVLWIGTENGLNKFDRKTDRFIHYQNDPENNNSLSANSISSILEDHAGMLWIGTYSAGFNKFDQTNNAFSHYGIKDGLPNDVVYGIVEGNRNNLWISTNKGLSKFNPQTGIFRNYDIRDGLQSNEFNAGAYYKTKNGEILFGGINGLNIFFPDSIRDNPNIPPVVVTDMQIFNKSVPIGETDEGRMTLTKSIIETDKIILSHKDYVVSFEFAALDFIAPDKNNYAYILEGFEKEWNFVGNRRFVTYTNLPHGKYTLRVMGSNNDNVWNKQGVSLRIIVTPPFWQTFWFRVSSFLIVSFLILTFYRIRTRSIRKRNERLEQLNIALNEQIAERKLVEDALRENEEKYRSLTEQSPVGIILHQKGKLVFINTTALRILKYDSIAEVLDKPIIEFVHPDYREQVLGRINTMLSTKGKMVEPIEEKFIRKDGSQVDVVTIGQSISYKGAPAVQASFMDISERKRADEQIKASLKEKEVLLKEIHHRVKNNLQVISSLLNLQSRHVKDNQVRELFKDSQHRVRSMAFIHESLYQSKDLANINFGEYIQNLTEYLSHSYRGKGKIIDMIIDVEKVTLSVDKAIPCGLIINELVSNSLKHAFPTNDRGEIRVDLQSGTDGRLLIIINDNGIGFPVDLDFKETESLGLQLVNTLVDQIEGDIELHKNDGTEFRIAFSQ